MYKDERLVFQRLSKDKLYSEQDLDDLERNAWMEASSIKLMLAGSVSAEYMIILTAGIIANVLYHQADRFLLFAWTAASIVSAFARLYTLGKLKSITFESDFELIKYFHKNIKPLYVVSTVLSGVSSYLIFNDERPLNQYICISLMMGWCIFYVHFLSPHRPTALIYANLGNGIWLIFILYNAYNKINTNNYLYHISLIILFVLYWMLSVAASKSIARTHLESLKSQYQRRELIRSLKSESDLLLKEKIIAQEAVAAKRSFIATAAHDIRQPVLAMSLYADWLGKEPELVQRITPKILEAAKSVNFLFDSLFDLDTIESGRIQPELSVFNPAALLHDIINQYSLAANEKGIALKARIKNVQIYSDQILFKRIIDNLIANAIRYTNSGQILLAVRLSKKYCQIEIWDTGIGIPLEFREKIFKEFFKIRDGHNSEEGFGLGLPIVKRLTQLLPDTSLEMKSEDKRGSVFKLRVPLATGG